ncbi:hypothetical protein [Lutimonas zeaxanthinifaciens]|uniref:hypothetical protein n=1 Tax=Lutimonas zeaxanthinifaciens TaxID=3060215 RepID=UPI00265CF2DB|nr:hypothetical protein [Lutimonas sp. YSD2104]WKK65133.1 hypothetical protein QZH61_11140 [Lutimonas sp. YSD2104]
MGLRIYWKLLILTYFTISSCSSSDDVVEPLESQYFLDGKQKLIQAEMYRESTGEQGVADQIRLLEPLDDPGLYDLIIFSPVPGASELEGVYIYSKTGDIGTYDLSFVHSTDGNDQWDWYTNGENGLRLEIQYMGKTDGIKQYRIVLDDFDLNYGYWDYLGGKWVSQGFKKFSFSYEGPLNN